MEVTTSPELLVKAVKAMSSFIKKNHFPHLNDESFSIELSKIIARELFIEKGYTESSIDEMEETSKKEGFLNELEKTKKEYIGQEEDLPKLDSSGFADFSTFASKKLKQMGFSGSAIIAIMPDEAGASCMASVYGKTQGIKQGCMEIMKKIDKETVGWK